MHHIVQLLYIIFTLFYPHSYWRVSHTTLILCLLHILRWNLSEPRLALSVMPRKETSNVIVRIEFCASALYPVGWYQTRNQSTHKKKASSWSHLVASHVQKQSQWCEFRKYDQEFVKYNDHSKLAYLYFSNNMQHAALSTIEATASYQILCCLGDIPFQ